MTPTPYPKEDLDYGGPIDLTISENEELQQDMQTHRVGKIKKPTIWTKATSPHRSRKLRNDGRLKLDETHLADVHEPEAFWIEVLKLAPPKKWMDSSKVLSYLALSRPLDKPSNGKVWSRAREWLDDAIRQGSQQEWKDDILINTSPLTPEFWDAIRIIGDSLEGFGTFPRFMREKMSNAGFTWIGVDPETRIIPKCWEKWARMNDITFKATRSLDEQIASISAASVSTNLPRRRTRASHVSNNLNKESDEQPSNATEPQDQQPTTRESSQETMERTNQVGTSPVSQFVETNEQAKKALEMLEARDIPPYDAQLELVPIQRPSDSYQRSEVWKAVEANLDTMNRHIMQVHNEVVNETHTFVARSIKESVLSGPIEGLIRQILEESLRKMSTAMQETSTLQEQRIADLEAEVYCLKNEASQRAATQEVTAMEEDVNEMFHAPGEDDMDGVEDFVTPQDEEDLGESLGSKRKHDQDSGDEPATKRNNTKDEANTVPIRFPLSLFSTFTNCYL